MNRGESNYQLVRLFAVVAGICLSSVSAAADQEKLVNSSSNGQQQWTAEQLDAAAGHYVVCSACHLPDGNGVPGAFPPLAGRISDIAASDQGRRYLVAVINNGLGGTISVDGATYNGFMQGFRASMDDAAVSEVLNYLVFKFEPAQSNGFRTFSAQEVQKLREDLDDSGQSILQLRSSVAVLR